MFGMGAIVPRLARASHSVKREQYFARSLLVVPFAAGGTTDIIARAVGQKLGEAAPDGYTFFMATVAHTMAPGLYKSLPCDFSKDLDPIGLVALTPNVLLVNPSVPVKSVAEPVA
jgi:tripartite-type tricarboxylate transporter receptor subunit TctC